MIIVIDTNIVFSAILNTESIIGDIILNSNTLFQFWSCRYLLNEIDNHWEKLIKVSKLKEENIIESQRIIYKNINFVDEWQIPKEYRLTANNLVKNIDVDDIVFIALNEFQSSLFWTGDKSLISGLRLKGYDRVVTTEGMVKLRNSIENK